MSTFHIYLDLFAVWQYTRIVQPQVWVAMVENPNCHETLCENCQPESVVPVSTWYHC